MSVKNDARIHVRLPIKLKEEVEEYARLRHIKISALVVRLLSTLIQADKAIADPDDAEQV